MSYLLCHDCYMWVEPYRGRCPECDHPLDVAVADPEPAALSRTLGQVVRLLGEVQVRRPLLPEIGTLWQTDAGLFFVPHEAGVITRRETEEAASTSLFWALCSLFWTPLIFVLPFLRTGGEEREVQAPVLRPRTTTAVSASLAALLMQDPGAFFVPRSQIRRLHRRRGWWVCDRQQARAITLRALDDTPDFEQQLQELAGQWANEW